MAKKKSQKTDLKQNNVLKLIESIMNNDKKKSGAIMKKIVERNIIKKMHKIAGKEDLI